MAEGSLLILLSLAIIFYGLGFIVLSVLTLLPIKSIFEKKFSLSKLLKKSIDVFIMKPDLAKILLILVFFHAFTMFFAGGTRFMSDLTDVVGEESEVYPLVVMLGLASRVITGASWLIFVYPMSVLAQGFLILVYKNYLKTKKIDSGLWRKIISIKGLYLLIASVLAGVILLTGLGLFLFPAIIFYWTLLYVPYLIILQDMNPISAIGGSWKVFRNRTWDTIFLSTMVAASNLLLLTNGLESLLHFLIVMPITTFMVAEYLAGGTK